MKKPILIIAGLWLANATLTWFAGFDGPGEYGDAFGSLNTLFSGLAFAAIYFSLKHENEDRAAQEVRHREIVEIQALTAYIETMKTCWLNNEQKVSSSDSRYHAKQYWADSAEQRYKQMVEALKLLEERIAPEILSKCKSMEERNHPR